MTTGDPFAPDTNVDLVHRAVGYEHDAIGRVTKATTTFVEPDHESQPAPGGEPQPLPVRTVSEEVQRTFVDGKLVETHIDAKQQATVTYYDAFGRVDKIVMPAPGANGVNNQPLPAPVIMYEYYADGRLKKEILTYDGATDDDRRATEYTYDDRGRVRTVTSQGVTVTYVHDALNRVVQQNLPDGSYQKTTYNSRGEVIAVAHFQSAGDKTPLTSVAYVYDEVGALLRQTVDNRHVISYTRDELDRVRVVKQEDLHTALGAVTVQQISYSAAGMAREVHDALGTKTEHHYDALGRLKKKSKRPSAP